CTATGDFWTANTGPDTKAPSPRPLNSCMASARLTPTGRLRGSLSPTARSRLPFPLKSPPARVSSRHGAPPVKNGHGTGVVLGPEKAPRPWFRRHSIPADGIGGAALIEQGDAPTAVAIEVGNHHVARPFADGVSERGIKPWNALRDPPREQNRK